MAKRYYNLEKETKEYLKACEAKNSKPFRDIRDINDIIIKEKANNKRIDFIKDLNLDRCLLWLDAGMHSSYPGTGTSWFDLTQNNNNGILSNSNLYRRDFGGVVAITGNTHAEVASSDSLNFSEPTFTINYWLKLNQLMPVSFFNLISKKAVFNNNLTGWMFWYDTRGNPLIQLRLNSDTTNDATREATGNNLANLNNLNWVNLTLTTVNGGTVFFYVNGLQVGAPVSTGNFGSLSNTTALRIGAAQSVSSPNMFVSNVQIYNRVLTSIEVLQNYNALRGRFGL